MNDQQIKDVKNLIKQGITKDTFLKLILHCTDGPMTNNKTQYANYLSIDEWIELYKKQPSPNLKLTKEILIAFFEYMILYYPEYIGKNGNIYFVKKTFTNNDLRKEYNYNKELIVFKTLEE